MIVIILPVHLVFPAIYAIALSFISEIYPDHVAHKQGPVEAIGIE
jgi:hypothetical protein